MPLEKTFTENKDEPILDTIMRLYNTTEIDWEEVRFLWIGYLEKGNLYFSEAIKMARMRIAREAKAAVYLVELN